MSVESLDAYKSPYTGSHSEGNLAARNDLLKSATNTLDRALIILTLDYENYLTNHGSIQPMPWEYLDYAPNDPSMQFYRVIDHINEQTTGARLGFDVSDDLPKGQFVVGEQTATDFFRNTKYGQQRTSTLESIKGLLESMGINNRATEPKEAVAEIVLIRFTVRAMIDNEIPERDIQRFMFELSKKTKDEAIIELMSALTTELEKQREE